MMRCSVCGSKEHKDFDCDEAKCPICGNIDHMEEDCAAYELVSNEMCMVTWPSDDTEFFSAEEW